MLPHTHTLSALQLSTPLNTDRAPLEGISANEASSFPYSAEALTHPRPLTAEPAAAPSGRWQGPWREMQWAVRWRPPDSLSSSDR